MTTITVKTARPYDIFVGERLRFSAGPLAREVNGGQKALIVSDSNVAPLYAKEVAASLDTAGYETGLYVFPAGEESKRLDRISEIYARLAAAGFTRKDLLVALGGGVTGDMTGFAAATWLRGIDFVQMPTSLLAQVDSSVGGKTGVDIPQGKNLVGAFWQPVRVLADTDTLHTLSPAFTIDGLAEVIKTACIKDFKLFEQLEGDCFDFQQAITRCMEIKRDVVERDEKEAGERKLLNFGHTLGHALEKYYHYQGLTHGCAVAVGMAGITAASEQQGLTAPGTTARLTALLEKVGLPVSDPAPLAAYLSNVTMDKKRTGSQIDLVVLKDIGHAFVYPCAMRNLPEFFGMAEA